MRSGITHITKLEFLPVFQAAFDTSITSNNIKGGFRGARLILFNLEAIISKLNIHIYTLIPLPKATTPWSTKTPRNQADFIS